MSLRYGIKQAVLQSCGVGGKGPMGNMQFDSEETLYLGRKRGGTQRKEPAALSV